MDLTAVPRKQGRFSQPEPEPLSDWNLTDIPSRLDPLLARWMPHESSLLLTEPVLRTLAQTPALISRGRLGVVHGTGGLGKSMLLGVIRAACPHRVAHVELKKNRTSKQAYLAIYTALTGMKLDASRYTEDGVEQLISVELSRRPTLLILDEIQYLPPQTLLQFRRLADSSYRPFGMLFAGVNVIDRLNADTTLGTRLLFDVELAPLKGAALIATLRDFHPLLADTPSELLERIDKVKCGGNWRLWAQFIESVQDQHGRDAALTPEVAKATLWTKHRRRLDIGGLT